MGQTTHKGRHDRLDYWFAYPSLLVLEKRRHVQLGRQEVVGGVALEGLPEHHDRLLSGVSDHPLERDTTRKQGSAGTLRHVAQ